MAESSVNDFLKPLALDSNLLLERWLVPMTWFSNIVNIQIFEMAIFLFSSRRK